MYDISPIHAFSDNFIWLIRARHGGRGVVVDPGDARPVLERLNAEGMELGAILVTHKHADHVGGIRELRAHYGDIPVYGPAHEPIPEITHRLSDGDRVVLLGGTFVERMQQHGYLVKNGTGENGGNREVAA